jgi:hypothetical protein
MLNNNQNLNGRNLGNVQAQPRLDNINLNVDGIELGQVKEVQYVTQPTAPTHNPSLEDEWRREQKNKIEENRNRIKSLNTCSKLWIILFVIGLGSLAIFAAHNSVRIDKIDSNDTTDSESKVVDQGDPGDTLTFFVEDNKLYTSKSTDPIFDLSQLQGPPGEKGENGENGITPNLYVEDDKLFSSTSSKPLIDFSKFRGENGLAPKLYVKDDKLYSSTSSEPILNLEKLKGHSPELDIHTEGGNLKIDVDGKEKTSIDLHQELVSYFLENGLNVEEKDGQLMMEKLDGTWVKINVRTHSIGEYMAMPECPGVKQAGKTYDPIKDEFFSGIFEESYQKRHTYNNHFDDVCRFPDFVKTIESDFKANQKATSNTITSREQYQQTKSNGASASVGYGMFFSANVNTVTEKSMNAFSSSGAAIVQTSLNHQLHVVTIEPLAASKYIRSDILKMVEDLPTNYLENLSDYERFFEVVKGYFVVSKENVGGSILSESTIENWNSLSRKYTSADIEGGVSASIGLFGGSAGGSSSDYQSSMDSDFINSLSTSTVIFGGDATGDLTSPSETITNFKNWDNKEWQKYFERVKKSPTVIGLNVDPLWVYFEGDNREKIKDYMLYYFGTTEDTKYRMRSDIAFANKKIDELRGVQSEAKKKIDDVVKIVDDNKSQTENSINDNKAALDRSIHSVSNKVPCSATASFVNCHDVGKAEMGGHGHDNVCSTGEIVQTMDMFHSYGNAFYVTNVHCCRIQINLWNGNNGASC